MDFNNEKIIVCLTNDISIYWVHNLEHDKIIILEDDNFIVYRSSRCLYLYYKKDFNTLYHYLLELNNKNYVHVVMTDFVDIDNTLEIIDYNNKFDYSIVNHMGETIYDDSPRKIKNLNNIKYYFSCGDLTNKVTGDSSDFQKQNKFIMDHRYSLIYFYIKLGFNFFEKGEIKITNDKRINKLFVYSKSKNGSERERLLEDLIVLDRTYNKTFKEDDVFWNEINYNNYHLSFYVDYLLCKFNLITETQPPSFNNQPTLSRYITEKTIKGLMVPTPSYLLSQKETYDSLKEYGFYFLNEEFGEYNLDNYKKFITFIKESTDEEFDNLFKITYEKSKLNKLKLEEYIYSDKIKELKLLLNEQI
jgi:hypothetical protein